MNTPCAQLPATFKCQCYRSRLCRWRRCRLLHLMQASTLRKAGLLSSATTNPSGVCPRAAEHASSRIMQSAVVQVEGNAQSYDFSDMRGALGKTYKGFVVPSIVHARTELEPISIQTQSPSPMLPISSRSGHGSAETNLDAVSSHARDVLVRAIRDTMRTGAHRDLGILRCVFHSRAEALPLFDVANFVFSSTDASVPPARRLDVPQRPSIPLG